LQKLQNKGLCLLKLKIDQKFTGLYGRTIIVFQTAVPGKQINTQYFSSGDIISISENSVPPSQLNNLKTLITGTVTKVASQSISIAIDNDLENLDDQLNDNDSYKLIKLSNDITYKRIKNALTCLKELRLNTRSAHIYDVLFLKVKPDRISFAQSSELFQSEYHFFNRNLDTSQQNAVRFTFEQKDLAIIHGPPGTGKTTTLVEIIKQNCLKYKQKILCCAPSNIAVDNLVERLARTERGYAPLKMVRLGHPARLLESIQQFSLDSVVSRNDQYKLATDIKQEMDVALKSLRKSSQRGEREGLKRELKELRKELYSREDRAIKDVLKGCDIVLATLTTTNPNGPLKNLDENHFDIVIIDECSQALEAACWIPILNSARKVILKIFLLLDAKIFEKQYNFKLF
jgi:ATP-dependent RNA/DNA helicase IGHMBP2